MIQRLGLLVFILFSIAATPNAPAALRLVITEIMYDPTSPESDDQQTEWVEVQNCGDSPVNLQGYQLTSGTKADPHAARQKYTFRDVTIAAHAYLVIGIGSQSMYHPYDLPTFGVYC